MRASVRLADVPRSVWWLVAANIVPLVGVLFLGWELGEVMLLFWAENIVIGVFAILRLALVAGKVRFFLVPFFTLHYGIFTAGHGLFVVFLFLAGEGAAQAAWVVLPGVVGLFVSHGASFVTNFLRGGERARMRAAMGVLVWKKTGENSWSADPSPEDLAMPEVARGFEDVGGLMTAPYKRVVIMHVTIILAGFLMVLVGSPKPAILLLVGLKVGLDARAHLAERRRNAAPAQASSGIL